jgi:hypothetical protein
LTFNVEDADVPHDKLPQGTSTYDLLVINCFYNEEYRNKVINGLNLFLKEDIQFDRDYLVFIVGSDDRLINKDNYEQLRYVLRVQNGLNNEDEFKPTDNKAQSIIERLKQMRKKYAKNNNDNTQTLADVISALCAKHPSINLLNVKDLTLYQVFDQFRRLNAIDNYFINVDSLMHGASDDDVTLKHWSMKID